MFYNIFAAFYFVCGLVSDVALRLLALIPSNVNGGMNVCEYGMLVGL